jgi:hypothetical protein
VGWTSHRPQRRQQQVIEVEVANPRGQQFVDAAAGIEDGDDQGVNPPVGEGLEMVAQDGA